VRNILKIKKVGHAGTLDPFAEGVLLLCIGQATKSVTQLMNLPKIYSGIIELGKRTNTLDVTGKVISKTSATAIQESDIKNAAEHFTGEIEQIPPMFSAVKIGGKRLYKLARQDKQIERKPRTVTIYKLIIKKYFPPYVSFSLKCSRGTYIRTLAQDLGQKLGCDAYLKTLMRDQIGNYKATQSIRINQLVAYLETV